MNLAATKRAFLLTLTVCLAVSSCGRPGSAGAVSSTDNSLPSTDNALPSIDSAGPSVELTDSNGMRPGGFPTTKVEPPPGADRPDGPPQTPDSELTAADLLALLTTPASAPSTTQSCAPDEVSLALTGLEAAAGHRYARLIATNISNRECSLLGWPGLGLRGEWGTPFPTVPEQSAQPANRVGVPEPDANTAVTLAIDGTAAAELEWTGSLAGAYDESVSLIAVQFTIDATPAKLIIDPADHIDLGPETTVRIGPWGPASG